MRRICRCGLGLLLLLSGCQSARKTTSISSEVPSRASRDRASQQIASSSEVDGRERADAVNAESPETSLAVPARTVSHSSTDIDDSDQRPDTGIEDSLSTANRVELEPNPASQLADIQTLSFDSVIGSVYDSYPLLQAALYSRNIALGQQVGASGAFDLKLKGASENGPLGFYETYRQSIGVEQPTMWGGQYFAGYRLGRGDYQPWYQERETNDGGEFKAGVQIPLARNRAIDARRAELWKAGYGRQLAEPDIQAQLIGFVLEASRAYWSWVAAGENHRIAERILNLAQERTSRIKAQVDAGLIDPPELTDNLRLVSIRQAKLADTRRKLMQTAAKLSVYFRDVNGQPIVVTADQLPGFPEPTPVDALQLEDDIATAMAQRPELQMLDLYRRQLDVDYSEAANQLQPELDAVLWGSQDTGAPTSKKRDKSELEAEASVYLDVPMQRRKARGKMTEVQGKIAQVNAKRRIVADKISVDVQAAHAALVSAYEQVDFTGRAIEQAEDLANRERQNQEAGLSDLLKVTLREQYAVESAEKHVDALLLYYESQADYRAALGLDRISR